MPSPGAAMVNYFNPDPEAVEPKQREANRDIRALENDALSQMKTARGDDMLSAREREEQGVSPKVPNHRNMTEGQRGENRQYNKNVIMGLLTSKKLRKRSSLITLLLLLFGGGSFFTVFLSPSLAIVHMKEVLTSNLNTQLKDIDERSAILMRSKLKDLTKGSCGAIKIKCDFTTITEKQAEKFKAAGIEVKIADERTWYNNKRGKIEKITFTDTSSKEPLVIEKAADLQKALLSSKDTAFRAAMLKGYNPLFAGLTDKVMLRSLQGFKASKGLLTKGNSDEERQKNVDSAVAGVEDGSAKSIVTKTDEKGNTHYYDSDSGIEMTKEQVDGAQKSAGRIAGFVQSGGFKNMLTNAAKGANILAYVDTACTVFNSIRTVSALAKTVRESQAVRYALAMVLTPADSIKAGDAQEGDINFVGNTLAATQPEGKTVDTSKIMLASSSEPIPMTDDPEANMSAYDSPFYKMVAYDDTPQVSLRASQYMLGGTTNIFNDATTYVSNLIAGSADPQKVSEMCGYIQNPVVRLAGLGIGVAAGIGTFGVTTALSVGGSLAVAMLLPYAEGQLADMVAGNAFTKISGIDSGDAAVAGSLALFGDVFKKRGGKPLSADQAVLQTAANKNTYNQYVALEQYNSRDEPFNVNNPYSFMGTVAGSIVPALQTSKTSASTAMMKITNLIPTSFASLIPSAKAKSANYFEQCNDIGYARLGLGGNAACGLTYGLMSNLDPVENVDWMLANNEIDNDGEAKAEDGVLGSGVWNYQKFLKECANRTMGWGENQDENQGDGSNCVSDEKESKNVHYRTYTFDKSINDTLNGDPVASSGSGDTGIEQTGDETKVSTDDWKYPTATDLSVKKGYAAGSHEAVDLASTDIDKTLGAMVYAAYDGKITYAKEVTGFGFKIIIEHEVKGVKVSTVYANLSTSDVKVREGDQVKAGDPIGRIGNSGESGGPSLHFEVWNGSPLNNGKPRDPTEFLDAAKKAAEVVRV